MNVNNYVISLVKLCGYLIYVQNVACSEQQLDCLIKMKEKLSYNGNYNGIMKFKD